MMAVICKRARVLVPTYGAKGSNLSLEGKRWRGNSWNKQVSVDNPNLLFVIEVALTRLEASQGTCIVYA